MPTAQLPIHPTTGLTALGIIGGRPVWPVLGGNGEDPTPETRTGQPAPAANPAPTTPTPAAPTNGPDGFPLETPVVQMTDAQQAAYWRHHARKHEDRAKAAPSDEELAELRAAADKVKALEDANRTDLDKAVERADTATADLTQARTDLAARDLELARLRAAVTRGLPDDVGTRLLSAARRITGATSEELDADASDYFTAAPLQVPAAPQSPPPNPSFDQGPRNTPGGDKPSVDRGRALFESRKPTRK